MITRFEDFYAFVEKVIRNSKQLGNTRLADDLEDAMALGSSGLEIIGAIRRILENELVIVIAMTDKQQLQDAIEFVNKAYGDR